MAKIIYSLDFAQTFYDSFDEELEYVAQFSETKGIEIIEELKEKLDILEKMPFLHPECRELPTKNKIYRSAILSEKYRVIYKVKAKKITILSLFNTKRNPSDLKKLRRK